MQAAFKKYLDQTLNFFASKFSGEKSYLLFKPAPDKVVVQTSSKFITAGDPMKVAKSAS